MPTKNGSMTEIVKKGSKRISGVEIFGIVFGAAVLFVVLFCCTVKILSNCTFPYRDTLKFFEREERKDRKAQKIARKNRIREEVIEMEDISEKISRNVTPDRNPEVESGSPNQEVEAEIHHNPTPKTQETVIETPDVSPVTPKNKYNLRSEAKRKSVKRLNL